MSSHSLMTMLAALLLAFTARTLAEETNMNVSGKQMVQEFTKGNMSIGRNHSVATFNDPTSQSKTLLRGTVSRSASSAIAEPTVVETWATTQDKETGKDLTWWLRGHRSSSHADRAQAALDSCKSYVDNYVRIANSVSKVVSVSYQGLEIESMW
eukprot:CAMPEP_0114663232 /NCGR_PEP_ID=MMETSP0191-20121206/26501_1 /TAXON_ID=126664 /ORGANISM="Sorites sp." /LENGTH=153 /DNA_ID=CAMNT_0001901967 /DNA_START=73 /DNA_END=531 /DNA_ORIENTATION=+